MILGVPISKMILLRFRAWPDVGFSADYINLLFRWGAAFAITLTGTGLRHRDHIRLVFEFIQ